MPTAHTKYIGYILIVLALAVGAFLLYSVNEKSRIPLVFSQRYMLDSIWRNYKTHYLENGTLRTMDTSQGNITTSEGESYTMLRSVWMDDEPTFDASWTWTKNNLQHKDDHLMSWLFGRLPNGRYGVLTARGGDNSASDADTDMALALLFAHARWNKEQYFGDAVVLIQDIWNKEVVTINGVPYMAANNVEATSPKSYVIVNPSYLAPYAYRIFARVDPSHPWNKLVDSSYGLIERSSAARLDKSASAMIPPDWVGVDKTTGAIVPVDAQGGSNLTSNYSFDALRLPWRIALDYQWNGDPRAAQTLANYSFLGNQWDTTGKLAESYTHDGKPVTSEETPAMYGGTLGYFLVADPHRAQEVYSKKLLSLYDPDSESWRTTLSYYDDNWAWFGMALYGKWLPNIIAETFPSSTPNSPSSGSTAFAH